MIELPAAQSYMIYIIKMLIGEIGPIAVWCMVRTANNIIHIEYFTDCSSIVTVVFKYFDFYTELEPILMHAVRKYTYVNFFHSLSYWLTH